MTLIDKEEIIVGDYNTAKVLNSFFSNIVSHLNIAEYLNCEPHASNISDPVLKFAVRYRNHPSRRSTQQTTKTAIFLFKDIFADILVASFNDSVERSNFPSSLKKADITSIFKKGDRNSKDNYRPVNILPNVSNIFEQCIFRQFYSFMLEFWSKYQCGFRKGYNTQHCLLAMLENSKSAVDKGKLFGALLTDLPKAFDCHSHKLPLAKRHAYGFSIGALRLIHNYLTNRKQRTKVNLSYNP